MANTPRSKAATKQAIQAANPLNQPDIGSNLGADDDRVPDEFRAPSESAQPPKHLEPEILEVDLQAILGGDYDAFTAWKAERDIAAQMNASAIPGAVARPLGVAPSEQQTHISESGRAPRVADADRVWIVLDDNDEIPPGGQFIGVNGVGYQLLAGIEAFVPRAVCEVLDHAIKSVPIQDNNTKRIIGWRPRKRFPYTIVNKRAEA